MLRCIPRNNQKLFKTRIYKYLNMYEITFKDFRNVNIKLFKKRVRMYLPAD